MTRLIDADALIEKYGNWYVKDTEEHTQWGFVGSLRTLLKEWPTIEAYPCALCAYNHPSSGDGKPCAICPAVAKAEMEEE